MRARIDIPIATCDENERPAPNRKYGTSRVRPKHPNHGQAKKDLKEWGEAWGDWIGLVTEEIVYFLKKSPEAEFEEVIDKLNDWGVAMNIETCNMLKALRGQSVAAIPEGGVIGNSTQPPPPPFKGGGRD